MDLIYPIKHKSKILHIQLVNKGYKLRKFVDKHALDEFYKHLEPSDQTKIYIAKPFKEVFDYDLGNILHPLIRIGMEEELDDFLAVYSAPLNIRFEIKK